MSTPDVGGHDAVRTAKYILWVLRDAAVTPMQLLKLVYISHGWMLGLYGRPLINAPVEAWPAGPVVPVVYHAYRRFAGGPILSRPRAELSGFGPHERSVMRQVCDGYGRYSEVQLATLTRRPGAPWDAARRRGDTVIPDGELEDFYRRKAETDGAYQA